MAVDDHLSELLLRAREVTIIVGAIGSTRHWCVLILHDNLKGSVISDLFILILLI